MTRDEEFSRWLRMRCVLVRVTEQRDQQWYPRRSGHNTTETRETRIRASIVARAAYGTRTPTVNNNARGALTRALDVIACAKESERASVLGVVEYRTARRSACKEAGASERMWRRKQEPNARLDTPAISVRLVVFSARCLPEGPTPSLPTVLPLSAHGVGR